MTPPKCQSAPSASSNTLRAGSADAARNSGSLTLTSSLNLVILNAPCFGVGVTSLVTGNAASCHLNSPPSSTARFVAGKP